VMGRGQVEAARSDEVAVTEMLSGVTSTSMSVLMSDPTRSLALVLVRPSCSDT